MPVSFRNQNQLIYSHIMVSILCICGLVFATLRVNGYVKQEVLDCEKVKMNFYYTITNTKTSVEAVSRDSLSVSWGDLVSDVTVKCLDHVELREGNERHPVIFNETQQLVERKAFIVNSDICLANNKEFQVFFFSKDEGGGVSPVRTKKAP